MDNLKVVIVEPGWVACDRIALGKQDTRLRFTIASELRPAGQNFPLVKWGESPQQPGFRQKSPALADRWTAWRTTYGRKTHRFQCAALGRSGWTTVSQRTDLQECC